MKIKDLGTVITDVPGVKSISAIPVDHPGLAEVNIVFHPRTVSDEDVSISYSCGDVAQLIDALSFAQHRADQIRRMQEEDPR